VDSLDVIKVCLRRWYIFLPLLVIAAGAGVGLGRQLKPSYTSIGSYAFVYPHPDAVTSTAADPRNFNPLVGNGNAALLGEAVQADLNSTGTQSRLGGSNRGYSPDEAPSDLHYVITIPQDSASYVIQTWADSAKEASDVVQAVLQAAPKSAKDAQERAGAPELSRYTVFVTAPTQTTELPAQSPMKPFLTVMAIGIVVGAALSLLFDRILLAKNVRRQIRRVRPTRVPQPDRSELRRRSSGTLSATAHRRPEHSADSTRASAHAVGGRDLAATRPS
jgi:hypothetical protein